MMFATARDMANDINTRNKLTAMIQKAEIDGRWQVRFSDDVFVNLKRGEKAEANRKIRSKGWIHLVLLEEH